MGLIAGYQALACGSIGGRGYVHHGLMDTDDLHARSIGGRGSVHHGLMDTDEESESGKLRERQYGSSKYNQSCII